MCCISWCWCNFYCFCVDALRCVSTNQARAFIRGSQHKNTATATATARTAPKYTTNWRWYPHKKWFQFNGAFSLRSQSTTVSVAFECPSSGDQPKRTQANFYGEFIFSIIFLFCFFLGQFLHHHLSVWIFGYFFLWIIQFWSFNFFFSRWILNETRRKTNSNFFFL